MNCTKVIYDKLSDYIDYFKIICNEFNPLGKLFKTSSSYYIYDTGTNKVMDCNEIEYYILDSIMKNNVDTLVELKEKFNENQFFQALENVKASIENENILKSQKEPKFYSPSHFENLDNMLDNKFRQVVLELTEKCNLRCRYCIYNDDYDEKRNHGTKNMSKEVAIAAIDYANSHGDSEKGISVSFYGGEPLVNFDLLKYCIEYSQKTIIDKKLSFSMTTNGTLMTKEIAEFLASIENLSVVCSIDGPKDIHDSYRKYINGNGTFNDAIRGLKYLVLAFGEKAKTQLSLSMVFTPPFTSEKLIEMQEFFNSLDWLPKEINKLITYPSPGTLPKDIVLTEEEQQNNALGDWSKTLYLDTIKNNTDINFFTKKIIEDSFVILQKRPILDDPSLGYPLNGCCIPGSRKLYITVNGDFLVCERIAGSPIIGNVFTGIDKEKIKNNLVEEYAHKSISKCGNCWAARLCSICYSSCYTDGKFDIEKKLSNCDGVRQLLLENLSLYHECLEINEKKLEYLNDAVMI
ncbi:radical SAM protein [Inconstantimicrobium mannanitabidum]|uniref:Radical SAM protein n=1 Tax=Inconstantimicrobium mannanitabidum TaxID=1604901 RepID=A0ACB5RHH0_9CLOT|nr:radical SAM protein [Clostridium sp. TW13]GKX68540.1 radical SAM protein [Clostridium sp. TW13]